MRHILYIWHLLLIHHTITCIFNYRIVESALTWSEVDVGDSKLLFKDVSEFASASVSHDWFFFGGISELKYSNSLVKFNSKSNKWSNVSCGGELPCPRAGSSLTLLNNSLILFGGQNYDGTFSDLFSLDLHTFIWKKLYIAYTIESRSGHATTSDGENIYIFGGYNENGTYLNDLWQLSIDDDVANFKLIGDGIVPETENATITYVLGNIYLIGGYKNNSKKVWKFTDKWNPITPPLQINLPEGHTSIRIGHSILILGGAYNNYSISSYNDHLWVFSITTNSWTILPIFNDIKYPISAAILYDTIYILNKNGMIYNLNNVHLCGFGVDVCSGKGSCNGRICSCLPGHYGHDCGDTVVSAIELNTNESNLVGTGIFRFNSKHLMISFCVIACLYFVTKSAKKKSDDNTDPLF